MDEHGKRLRAWLVASGVAAGATLAGIGIASAQTSTTTPPAAATAPAPDGRGPGGPGGPGGMHKGFGMGGGIHGEFVTPKQGGGYQTVATQMGDVTAVTSSSITIKSEDGYTKAYAVDDNTMVNAGNNGIDDVKTGDKVHVTATVADGKYHAVEVMDQTQGQRINDQWRPARPAPPAAATPAA